MLVQVLTRCGLPVVGLMFLCSCSTAPKKAPPPPPATAAPEDKAPRPLPPRPVSLGPQETAAKSVSRSEQIAQLVRAGTLVETGKECLVFSVSRAPKSTPGGLFEDAIVLSRLRGHLKKISGLPESVTATATVQGARAFLKLSDQITAEAAARAIDSALKTDGVAVVHVSTAPEVRL